MRVTLTVRRWERLVTIHKHVDNVIEELTYGKLLLIILYVY